MKDEVNASPQMASGHISTDELAEAAEQLLAADRAERVYAHLATCPDCADVAAALTATTELLAAEPTLPMPAAVFERLSEVVRAETRRRTTGQQTAADVEHASKAKRPVGNFGQHPDFDRKWSAPEQVRRGAALSKDR